MALFAQACASEDASPPASTAAETRADDSLSAIRVNTPAGTVELTCTDGICSPAEPVDLGAVSLHEDAEFTLEVSNASNCPTGTADPCGLCAITIAPNPDYHDLGIGFAVGAESEGDFELPTDLELPVTLSGAPMVCNESHTLDIPLTLRATGEEMMAHTTLVIESNADNAPIIELPITVKTAELPVAVATMRTCTDELTTDCGDPTNPILTRLYVDGEQSYDPLGGEIVSYQWEIIAAPQGADPSELVLEGQSSSIASFIPALAGQYTVRLTVNNDQGLQSVPTEESDLTINGLTNSGILIQLVWDHPTNNQDLHLVHLSSAGNFCSANGDCNAAEPSPIWFDDYEASTGPNPTLSRDDSDGFGPESITIDAPEAGTYRILTHYAPAPNSSGPTVQQVRIFINGTLQFTEQRTLTGPEQIWAIADIVWSDESEATITPYPSDTEGEAGAVAIGDASACDEDEGWVFPN